MNKNIKDNPPTPSEAYKKIMTRLCDGDKHDPYLRLKVSVQSIEEIQRVVDILESK